MPGSRQEGFSAKGKKERPKTSCSSPLVEVKFLNLRSY